MTISTGDIYDYKGFKLLAYPDKEGYRARIRRPDGSQFAMEGIQGYYFDTRTYPRAEGAIEQAKLAIDSGTIK